MVQVIDAAAMGIAAGEGGELRVALVNTREFGMVLSAGLGAAEARAAGGLFRRDGAAVHASVELTDAAGFLERFRRTFAHRRPAARGEAFDAALERCFAALIDLGRSDRAVNIAEVVCDLAVDGSGLRGRVNSALRAAPAARLPRPIAKIDKLIHPNRIGIVGVSATGMNFGRIILKNLMGSGYARERLLVIRPGETEIDGVACVESLAALAEPLDLLIVAVPSNAVYALVDEIIETGKVHAAMLIPGGLGETEASREPAAELAARINAAHGRPGGGPIFLGANCLGVVSHAGGYDSWFIPLERLPKPAKKAKRNSVLLSQSGAFMISRISRNPWLDPAYMMALGNQTDLTHGDMMSYFAGRGDMETIGLYIEGFKDGDGLDFIRALRRAVVAGKQVVVYKSGRTEAGAAGVMGHTASVAGDPAVFDSVLRQAGAMVAEDAESFDDLFTMAGAFHHKEIAGNRLGGISGAGYEAVGIADSIEAEGGTLVMGELSPETVTAVRAILVDKKLDSLVTVRNSIDINPGADDECHLAIVEAFARDPGIDAVVVGMDPTAPAVMALEASKLRPGWDIHNPKSSVALMPPLVESLAKPVVAVIDAGPLYDPMAAALMDRGVCVFRNCMRAVKALARYTEARLYAAGLQSR